ncbi:MAG: TRAP transporter substrate-binding protein [Alphaproteobacteria bacterium]|nr:TRAP transporter substrate-binding protein [Alphaproteobacteria bacterium]
MHTRTLFGTLAGSLLAVLAVATPGTAWAQAKYPAKIAHLESATQPRHGGILQVGALVKERTNGEVEFQIFPAAQLGDARQINEGVQLGSIEATVMPASFLAAFNPLVSVLDIPYLYPSDRAKASALRQGPFGNAVLKTFEAKGFQPVMLWPNGRKIMTSNKPLDDLAAFKGQRFRVMDSRILMEQYAAVGASAITLAFSETYSALQTGVVDGQENPPDSITTMKFFEVQKHVLVTEHGALEDVILFNRAYWNKLPASHRDAITRSFREVVNDVEARKDAAMKAAVEQIGKAGLKMTVPDAAYQAKLRTEMYPKARAAYLTRNGAEGEAIIKLYEEELKKIGG